jgi:CHAT domain-containing protein
VPSGKEIQQRLPANTALIEYVVGEQSLVVFVLTSDGLQARSIPLRVADLQARVDTLRDLLLRKDTNEWKLPAASLYRTLIEPVEEAGWLQGVKQLYIIPHATLHYVPFAALLKATNNRNHFLVDDYVLAYLPAAAALVYTNAPNRSGKSVLAMAPSSTRLQFTQRESQSVSELFPRQHMLLLGSRATESSFKRLANNYDVIHLATHGYFNKLNPLLSGLILEPDAGEDEQTADEVVSGRALPREQHGKQHACDRYDAGLMSEARGCAHVEHVIECTHERDNDRICTFASDSGVALALPAK